MSEKKCERKTRRYPWGANIPVDSALRFCEKVDEIRASLGLHISDQIIVEELNSTLPEEVQLDILTFRYLRNAALRIRRRYHLEQILMMRENGADWSEISRRLKITESSARLMVMHAEEIKAYCKEEIFKEF